METVFKSYFRRNSVNFIFEFVNTSSISKKSMKNDSSEKGSFYFSMPSKKPFCLEAGRRQHKFTNDSASAKFYNVATLIENLSKNEELELKLLS